jgi:molybdopterin synthase catalytic subunit
MGKDPIISVVFVEGEVDVPKRSLLPSIGCGGECIFVGRTRPDHHEKHGKLIALHYDCYKKMAQSQLEKLAKQAVARFDVRVIQICHSCGKVPIDGASVVIAVGSNHRNDAFLACRFLIDLLKLQATIWKQEVWADGTTWSTSNTTTSVHGQ